MPQITPESVEATLQTADGVLAAVRGLKAHAFAYNLVLKILNMVGEGKEVGPAQILFHLNEDAARPPDSRDRTPGGQPEPKPAPASDPA